ncbi:nitroreductase family [Thraustotheca clavata]|uniref:Nitroreductase family n=1 Tax=Thraustotheca clavata TaxID=74557 RepID=A0A1V9ZCH9_9STRA|nr:nitroreductase family [Thraustotheca clavata]
MSPFVNAKLVMSCSLAPCHIQDAKKGLEEQLNTMLMKYCDPVEGVLLAFNSVQLLNPYGHIINETPYIHIRVAADALVFRPQTGMELSAVVCKVGSNHIGLLLNGVFNVSIASDEMPEGYAHSYSDDAWVNEDGATIALESEVTFQVLRVHVAHGVISIDGSMRLVGKSSKKRKTIESTIVASPVKEKKSKKSKKIEVEAVEEEPTPKKAKKAKKSKDIENGSAKKSKRTPTHSPAGIPSTGPTYATLKMTKANVFRALAQQRHSINRFLPKAIDKNVVADILATTQRSPTSFNMQPYACVLIDDAKERQEVSTAMLGGNVNVVQNAPLVAVFAADLEPSKRVPAVEHMYREAGANPTYIQQLGAKLRMFGGEGHLAGGIRALISTAVSPLRPVPTYVPVSSWAYKQTMIAATTFMYAAESHEVGTHLMEGFDETRLRHILNIPDRYSIPVVIACGYHTNEAPVHGRSPRLPLKEFWMHLVY